MSPETKTSQGDKYATFIAALLFSLLAYLLLTAGSGGIMLWSQEELIVGLIFAVTTAFFVERVFNALKIKTSVAFLNPVRWFILISYVLGPFLLALTKANLDVAYRVITGKINPGIVKISPGLKTDLGITLLANSITLTPGTLSVEVGEENSLYVHWIDVKH
ncbi:MAG: Na+/H+ antiporter subunit E, partial [Candidatus Altiarchaeota archaeon]|nr:Na+/H+ antiporter subunit E [Candidatus Altiarchaeota archaeon]